MRKLVGAYDVGADRLLGHLEARSVNAKVVLEFLKDIRRRYPPEAQLYIVMDGLSAHWTLEIRQWALANHVGLLPTPTNASHLNRIEWHFWAYVEFVINGSDYPDWTEFSKATQVHPPTQPRPSRLCHQKTRKSTQGCLTHHYRRIDGCRPTSTLVGQGVGGRPGRGNCGCPSARV